MTLLRSQSKLRAESEPEPRTSVPKAPSHFTSCFSSLSGPSSEFSPHHSHCLQLMFIESPSGEAWGQN